MDYTCKQSGIADQITSFVEGMALSARGFIVQACESARANALNMASMEWWLFRPRRRSICMVIRALSVKALKFNYLAERFGFQARAAHKGAINIGHFH